LSTLSFGKRKGKRRRTVTGATDSYRIRNRAEITSRPDPLNWRLKPANRGRGTISLVARAIYLDGGGSGEVRARLRTATRQRWPVRNTAWFHDYSAAVPASAALLALPARALCDRSAPRAPQGSHAALSAFQEGAGDRRRRPQAGHRVSPTDQAVMRAGTRPRRWRREPRCGRRGLGARAEPESGRPPDMERRRVATGANHPASHSSAFAGCGAPTGDQSTDMNATRKPPRMCQDPITSPSRVSAGNRSRCRSPFPYVMNARTGR
jgi:hypothetical protein